jgi:hypothetical protein
MCRSSPGHTVNSTRTPNEQLSHQKLPHFSSSLSLTSHTDYASSLCRAYQRRTRCRRSKQPQILPSPPPLSLSLPVLPHTADWDQLLVITTLPGQVILFPANPPPPLMHSQPFWGCHTVLSSGTWFFFCPWIGEVSFWLHEGESRKRHPWI